jgi:hypothetical protein
MGCRKAELARRRIDPRELGADWSLHADGLAQHILGRLWGSAPWSWCSSFQHSGVPLLPVGQRHWGSTVLEEEEEEEPQAPRYGTQTCGMMTNSVNDYLWCAAIPQGATG